MDNRVPKGEPLPLDLVNTKMPVRGKEVDYLETIEGTLSWLSNSGFEAIPATRTPLIEARTAIRDLLENPASLEAAARINSVLDRGQIRLTLANGHPTEAISADEGWLPAWLAVREFLYLLEQQGDRVKRCAGEACVLYFLDTSRNGTRRWCSMETCGARAKSARHYARTKTSV